MNMKMSNFLSYRELAAIVLTLSAFGFSGCGSGGEPAALKPVFFPPAPDEPRLQFLKSFSGPEDIGSKGPSGFERFILGEPEKQEGIVKPYGIAIFEGKLYVCDVGRRMVEVMDPENHTFGYLTKDRRLMNPVNLYIDDGTKYVADPTAGAVFVFGRNNSLKAILGKELKIAPIDVVVRGQRCYVTDFSGNQIVVFDKNTGKEVFRIGKEGSATSAPLSELPPGEFSLISDLAIDHEGNIYVTDKVSARITKFDASGTFLRTIGKWGTTMNDFIRPKGIAVDRKGRIWVVDAAPEIAKIYSSQAELLLIFGGPGNLPGMMNLPAKIIVDYDNIELFREYAVEGAEIEFLVLVSNQYGLNKINVYGFGNFPARKVPQETE
jgi:hypothetical protein